MCNDTFKNRKQNIFKTKEKNIRSTRMSTSFHVIAHSIKLESATTLLRYKGFLVDRPYLCLFLLYPLISYVRSETIKYDQQSIRIDSARIIILRPNRAYRDESRLKNQFNNTKQSHTRCVYKILIEIIKNLHMISFQLCV